MRLPTLALRPLFMLALALHALVSTLPPADPYEAALQASTLISMIPTHTHVQSVYTTPTPPASDPSSSAPPVGPDQTVLAALKSGKLSPEEVARTLCVEQSTIRMDVSQEVGRAIEEAGAGWVDGPVSGGQYRIADNGSRRHG